MNDQLRIVLPGVANATAQAQPMRLARARYVFALPHLAPTPQTMFAPSLS